LTDYLAQYNISARQIRDTYQQRLDAAQAAAAENPDADPSVEADAILAETLAREEAQAEAVQAAAKNAQASQKKKAKKRKKKQDGENSDDEGINDLAYRRIQKLPGQLANCGDCEVRFTVTPYSKPNSDGDLLCPKCTKLLTSKEPVKKKAANRDKRRMQQSNVLDGKKQRGAKSLTEMCVEKVAACIDDVSEFGDIHPKLKESISMILSKRRMITPKTQRLFLEAEATRVPIYDCAKLQVEDFKLIATKQPNVRELVLGNCGQIKDDVVDHWIDHFQCLEKVRLEAPNLISDDGWQRFFSKFGEGLTELHLSWIDHAFVEDTAAFMITCCTNLRSLKLKKVWRFGQAGIQQLAQLKHLEVLTILNKSDTVTSEDLVDLIKSVGANLKTLSLLEFAEADDKVLEAIHTYCHELRILKLTKNDIYTSKGFTDLFTNWNNPPLVKLDVRNCCSLAHQDQNKARDGIGFDNASFEAAMRHSGSNLVSLHVTSNRHIERQALSNVFVFGKEYPKLQYLDMSFIGDLDDVILKNIERCCPSLDRIWVFGCWKLTTSVDIRPNITITGCLARDLAREQDGGYIGGRIEVPDGNDEDIAMLLSQEA
jgi:DNA repair protein RAD7